MGISCKELFSSRAQLYFRLLLTALFCLTGLLNKSAAQNPPSRPILFVHGFCGSAYDFEPLLSPLYEQLPRALYPAPTIYYVFYDRSQNATTFFTLAGSTPIPVDESSIPSDTRFFSIAFYDPEGQTTDATDVSKISVLNKAFELSQAIKHITAITHIKDVIVVAHSMGGLDTRAYIENMASAGICYNYKNNEPYYVYPSCTPGSGEAAYAGDVGDLITVDTPHSGAPVAELNVSYLEPIVGACIANPSVTRSELNLKALGGSGLVEALNYDGLAIAEATPITNSIPIQAVEDYFRDVSTPWDDFNGFLNGYSDDIVLLPSQSIRANLSTSNTSAMLQDVPVSYLSSDSSISGTSACWVGGTLHLPMLHFMTCLANQPDTQNAIAKEVNANAKGILTSIIIQATYDGTPWTGAVSYQIGGPDGPRNESSVPLTVTDTPLGTYSIAYIAGGPKSAHSPIITATPSPTIQSGQWAITYTLQFSSQNSVVATVSATSITSSSAILNGTVNPEGSPGYEYLQWGTDSKLSSPTIACLYQNVFNCPAVKVNYTSQPFSAPLTGLPSNTTIYYQTVFFNSNSGGYEYGAIQSFKTLLPVATTTAAISITSSGVTLSGTVNPEGSAGYMYLQWGTDSKLSSPTIACLYQNVFDCLAVKANYTTQSFSAPLTALVSNTTIYYQAVFFNSSNGGYESGAIQSFKTLLPVASTTAATGVTSSSARINGTVNPEGSPGYEYLQWGTDSKLSSSTIACLYQNVFNCTAVKVNYTAQPFSAPLTGIPSNTTIYFQTVFFNSSNGGYVYGAIRSLKTLLPIATTTAATSITSSSATLNGTVNPEGSPGYAYLQWGTDSKLSSPTIACSYQNVFNCFAVKVNYSVQSYSAPLSGLPSNTTIYYQALFLNSSSGGYEYGAIQSFKTLLPVATTTAATTVTSSSAMLNGTVNPEGSPGYAYLQWGTDSKLSSPTIACSYQNVFNCLAVKVDNAAQAFSTPLTGIASNATFYYQAVFFNSSSGGYEYGTIQRFKTLLPVATTTAATTVTSSGAMLNGTVNPEGSPGYEYLQWGTDSKLGSPTIACLYQNVFNCPAVKVNYTGQPFSAPLTGIPSSTNVYFQTVFFNSSNGGYEYSSIQSFETLLPVATTTTASSITSSTATLSGTVNPEGSPGYAYLQWGTDYKLSSPTIACLYQNVFDCLAVKVNYAPQAISTPVTGLPSDTAIYYQTVFFNSNNGGYEYGAIQSFKTLQPVATTKGASAIIRRNLTFDDATIQR